MGRTLKAGRYLLACDLGAVSISRAGKTVDLTCNEALLMLEFLCGCAEELIQSKDGMVLADEPAAARAHLQLAIYGMMPSEA